jgi:Spy/CpxP family protein refolding chaperone
MRFRIVTVVAWLILLSLLGIGFASNAQDPAQPPPPPNRGPGPDNRMLLSHLDLTDAQRSQISQIDQAERIKTDLLMTQLWDARAAIEDATANGQFDEQRIRTLAAAEAQLQIEMTVARARQQAAIYQILTIEQRAKLSTLRATQRPPGFPPSIRRQQY